MENRPHVERRTTVASAVLFAGGIVAIVGSVLPWLSVPYTRLVVLSANVSGTSGKDGKIVLACGIVLILIGLLLPPTTISVSLRRLLAVVAVVVGLAGGGLAAYDISAKDRQVDDALRKAIARTGNTSLTVGQIKQTLGVEVSIKIGLILSVVGGALGVVGGVAGLLTPVSPGVATGSESPFGVGERASAGQPPPVPPPPSGEPPASEPSASAPPAEPAAAEEGPSEGPAPEP